MEAIKSIMKPETRLRTRTRLYIASGGILLIGIVGAVLIYRSAMNDSSADAGYEVIGGFVYPGGGASNKKYVHDLQLYGGNAAMLGDQFTRWFFGLWQGTSLSYTVAFLALMISFVVFVVANNVQDCEKSANGPENNQNENLNS